MTRPDKLIMEEKLAEIKTDLVWIKNQLVKLDKDLVRRESFNALQVQVYALWGVVGSLAVYIIKKSI